jgi:methionyl-tRNA synthetase
MSKSLGNVVDPQVLIDTFGVEGTKFVILFDVSPLDDSNFDLTQSIQNYNSNLADNFGNLVVRVSNLVEKYCDGLIDLDNPDLEEKAGTEIGTDLRSVYANLENFNPQLSLKALFAESSKVNEYLEKTKPWMLAKDLAANKDQIVEILTLSARVVSELGKAMSIFLPEAGDNIYKVFARERITKSEIIFPKLERE